jgi:hypothetical protein
MLRLYGLYFPTEETPHRALRCSNWRREAFVGSFEPSLRKL